MEHAFPARRERGLLIRELPDEVLVYDTDRHEAHCLNRPAALVWEQCDGATPAGEIARKLGAALGVATDEDVVWHALEQLERFHLLEAPIHPAGTPERISRRDLIQRLGLAASAALPLVSSIAAPVPSQAQSATGSTGSTGPTGATGATGA